MVLNGLTSIERQSLVGIFGAPASPDAALNGPPARKYLKVGAVKRQIAKHLNETGQLAVMKHHRWDRDLAMEQYEADLMHDAQSLTLSSETAPCVG